MSLSGVGASVAASLLVQAGSEWTYSRGASTGTISFYKADLPPEIVDNGTGNAVEIIMASFRGLESAFSALFDKPQRGDRITNGIVSYEVHPVIDKCFYTIGGLIHIHAKRVAK